MIKWIAFNQNDEKAQPPQDGEYFVSNGEELTTAWWNYSMFEASSSTRSTYDMADVVLDIKVTHWAVIEDGMLPNKG